LVIPNNLLASEVSTEESQAVVIIAHIQTPQKQISKNTLRAIFSMHMQEWSNGSAIKVFVLADKNEIHQKFTKSQLGVFPYQLRRNWDRLVFSGTGEAPIRVTNLQQMKILVANTKGSIGYIPEKQLDPSVKQLKVN
jgi:ABC-type phosphate transport system substrate-binding protein